MLLYDSVADRQAEPRALACSLRRKEWVVDFLDVFAADAGACVLHDDFNFRVHRVRHDAQFTAFRHCIARIDEEIEENLLELPGITKSRRAICPKFALHTNPPAFQLMIDERNGFA